jgi:hypothetical protein
LRILLVGATSTIGQEIVAAFEIVEGRMTGQVLTPK